MDVSLMGLILAQYNQIPQSAICLKFRGVGSWELGDGSSELGVGS
jgi:hypothetical protein